MKTRQPKRRGAAVAEFALCLPVLIVLVVGGIECTSMIFLTQSLNVVAYEGGRSAIRNNATTADTLARCQEVIAERSIEGANVELTPANIDDADRGTQVTVRVTAPCASNSIVGLNFFSGRLSGQVVMIKE